MPVQINGKTRDILDIKKDLSEKELLKIVTKSIKLRNTQKIKKF